MPVVKRATGYSWGRMGKVFSTRAAAARQGRAIMAKKKKKGGRRG